MALTEKMKAFALAKMQGKSNKEAAILAGYSEGSAQSRGSQLASNPEVVAYLASLNLQGGGGIDHMPLGEAAINAEIKDMKDVNTALEFFQYLYRKPSIPLKIRMEAARNALPYETGKVAEKGKKEQRKQLAKEATQGGKFATLENQLRN